MSVAIVTGSAGLIGSETCKRFAAAGFDIADIDDAPSSSGPRPPQPAPAPTWRKPSQLTATTDTRDAERVNALFRDLGA